MADVNCLLPSHVWLQVDDNILEVAFDSVAECTAQGKRPSRSDVVNVLYSNASIEHVVLQHTCCHNKFD